MAKAKLKTYEEAIEAQSEGKVKVREAKQAKTDYLKTNKLKRNVDYSKDKKHGAKLVKLDNAIERTSNSLAKVNEQVKNLKPVKERVSKYEYPEGLTSDEKKKFRQVARAASNKDAKPKKEKAPKAKKEKVSKKKASKKSKKSTSND